MLTEACRVEVNNRFRKFILTKEFEQHLRDIATWLTSKDSTFGLFLCGGAGNGKTTILHALQNLTYLLRKNEPKENYPMLPIRGFRIISAKDLVRIAKAFNNQTKENIEDATTYHQIANSEILAIDDLGTEPRESIHYGDFITAAIDIITHRYEQQYCTLISSNLAATEIATYYDERIADRFREMMKIINFGSEKSFRKII